MVDSKTAYSALQDGKSVSRDKWNGMKCLYKANDGTFIIGIGVPANTYWEPDVEDLNAEDWIIHE